MSGELAERLARELIRCREASGHNRLSVEHFSRDEAARRGDEFFVHNTSLLKYEKGAWPSPPKLITLARAYGVPISRFFKAIGVGDSDLCGHVVRPEDARLLKLSKDPVSLDLHGKLQDLIESDGLEFRAVVSVIEMATKAARSTTEGSGSGQPGEAGPAVPGQFIIEMRDDSMRPELRAGDSLLVDRSEAVKSGDLVAVSREGRTLVRQLVDQGQEVVLRAFAEGFEEISAKSRREAKIQGVVLKVLERTLPRP